MNPDTYLQRLWYERKPLWLLILLLPLTLLFAIGVACRRLAYRSGVLRSVRMACPVIVVGNITVGGTGKTPLVIWLAELLRSKGRRVGIVMRGYGGHSPTWPRDVLAGTTSHEVGDEAVLLAGRTGAIVVAGPDRVAAATRAIERGADVVLSDDGLQHYRLARDAEIAVIDEHRALGNGWLLPSGPLREPRSRLHSVNLVVKTRRTSLGLPVAAQGAARILAATAQVIALARLTDVVSVRSGAARSLASFQSERVHAVAGIGNPQSFFAALGEAGLTVDARVLPDHAVLQPRDLAFDDTAPVLMTEKDAVKCRTFADERYWAVRLETEMSATDTTLVSSLVDQILRSHPETHTETR